MLRKFLLILCVAAMLSLAFAGCSQPGAVSATTAAPTTTAATEAATEAPTTAPTTEATEPEIPETQPAEPVLPDGVYLADFDTDSSMFHVSEACDGKGTLTVKDGQMVLHVSMPSKNVLNLFFGLAEDAQKEGAVLLEPTEDEVHYSDGTTETVFGFDIPVPYLDAEFDCALVGKKGTWYDHKVSVSNPVPVVPEMTGDMLMEVTLTGGSGRAFVESPALVSVHEDGILWATVVWSSPNYEYMLVDDVQYDPIQTEGNSTFCIPVVLDQDMAVSALTVAMSEPHLIDYVLHFDSSTAQEAGN